MTPTDEGQPDPAFRDWLAHAESDLEMAHLGRTHGAVLPEQVCFHAQQAVEKSLKAVLMSVGADFPLTHDIQTLLDLAKHNGIDVPENLLSADGLTPYAVETRYPGNLEPISDPDVDDAVRLAQSTVKWAAEHLGP